MGERFLTWLSPEPGLRWLDVGCGSGAFTELVFDRCAPAFVHGIDPSEEQLEFARSRKATAKAQFQQGDAMAQPFPDDAFDVAVMPLVIFFVPEPSQGVAEMARVVRPGGHVSAYGWDLVGGGFPYHAMREELEALGMVVPDPPSPWASKLDALQQLWQDAGLQDIKTHVITVERQFSDFDDYWETIQGGPSLVARLASLTPQQQADLKARMRERLPTDAQGRIAYSARAHAVTGRVP